MREIYKQPLIMFSLLRNGRVPKVSNQLNWSRFLIELCKSKGLLCTRGASYDQLLFSFLFQE